MFRIALLAFTVASAFAQDASGLFNRAPKKVDDALRTRIKEFYDLSQAGEYRKAEQLVAEDTKDYFYEHNKPTVLSYEIGKIEYSDGYTKAKAIVTEERRVPVPGFTDKPIKIPVPTTWKIDGGKWCWYIAASARNQLPMGTIQTEKAMPGAPSPGGVPTTVPTSVDQFMNLVHADKSKLTLKPGESGQITIENQTQGSVTLSIPTKPTGVEATFDHATVNSGQKAVLTVKAGDAAANGSFTVMVAPFGKTMPIEVVVE
ncbi:MAG TPA: hypothetical protein VHW24_19365 [Bryobacteraceae bacterium]|jgi:hypothetical protein|nr:hypothetical protein [Bryobacteraceae bacterium]